MRIILALRAETRVKFQLASTFWFAVLRRRIPTSDFRLSPTWWY
jgi:hypothetical protein